MDTDFIPEIALSVLFCPTRIHAFLATLCLCPCGMDVPLGKRFLLVLATVLFGSRYDTGIYHLSTLALPTLGDKSVLQQLLLHSLEYRLRTDFPDVVLKIPYSRPRTVTQVP